MRVPPGGSSLGSFLFTTSALAFGGPRSQIFNGWAPDAPLSDAALDLDFTTGTLDPRITFARGSTATYYNSSGVLTSAASGAPRFDYDPATLTARGLLMEEQRTNSCLNSEDFTGANWNVPSISVTANSIAAPDGTTTADLLTATGTTEAIIFQNIFVAGAVGSFYVKRGNTDWVYIRPQAGDMYYAYFNLATGAVGTTTGANLNAVTISDVGNGWWRITAGRTDTLTYFVFGIADANGAPAVTVGKTAYLWGAQVEVGAAFASSYIPTTTAAVTRSADTATMTGANFSNWYNASAGTFVAEYRPQNIDGTRPVVSINDTTANEAIRLYGSGADPKAIVVDGGATQADLDAGTITVNVFHKLGLAFTLNDFAACFDGSAAVLDTSGTLPTVTQLQYAGDTLGNVANLHIKRLQFFNTRKSDADLQALTVVGPPVGVGALVAQQAAITSTTGLFPAIATGALIAEAATVASTIGVSGSTITDTTLNASAAVLSSTTGVSGSSITDTTLNASAAVLSSTTGVSGSLITDTTLNASAAVLSSTTGLVRAIANPSALVAQAATVIGLGTGAGAAVIGAGALSARPATLSSTGLTLTIGSGALVDGSATLGALAVSGSVGVGNLNVTTADVEGLGYVEQGGVSIMVGGEWRRTTPYVRVGGAWKPATAWANVNGTWKRVA